MPQLFADNVKSTLAVQLLSNSTTLRVADFSKFPTLGTGDFFKLVISYGLDIEIVQATAADAPSSSFTVVRAQDGTTARTFPGGETQVFISPVASDHRFFQSLQNRANHVGTQDVSTITGLNTVLDGKVDKVAGKGLSTNDYAAADVAKLAGIAVQATKNATDAQLRDRGTHTGTQEIVTVAGLQAALDAKLPLTGGTMIGQLVGQKRSLTMSGAAADGGEGNGSFVARASSTGGDENLAGMTFWHDAYAIRMGVRNDGYFGLGGSSRAAWSLYSDPVGNLVAAGNIQAYSDPDLKDNVVPITNALELIAKLDGVRFVWNRKTDLIGKPGQVDVGVLADQVEAVMPEAVGRSIPDEDNGGHQWRTVDYTKLVPVLIQAVKELSNELDILKARVG